MSAERSADQVLQEYDDLLRHLHIWRQKRDDELRCSYDGATAALLRRIVAILDDASHRAQLVRADDFAPTVHAMHSLLGTSARAYGEAFAEAFEYVEDGDKMEAVEVFRRFLNTCPSEYFRVMARKSLEAIERRSITDLLLNPHW